MFKSLIERLTDWLVVQTHRQYLVQRIAKCPHCGYEVSHINRLVFKESPKNVKANDATKT